MPLGRSKAPARFQPMPSSASRMAVSAEERSCRLSHVWRLYPAFLNCWLKLFRLETVLSFGKANCRRTSPANVIHFMSTQGLEDRTPRVAGYLELLDDI